MVSTKKYDGIKQDSRLVVKGYRIYNIECVEYDLTFSSTLPMKSLRITIAIASLSNWSIQQLNLKDIYHNAEFHNDINMNFTRMSWWIETKVIVN